MEKLETRLLRQIGRANKTYELIENGDVVMVAVSGGKDSWAMLELIKLYQRRAPVQFKYIAVTLDQGQPGFPAQIMADWYDAQGHDHHIEYRDTYSVVLDKTPEGKAYCSLCSRMRRGILYRLAEQLGANKIALGHHRDDFIETLLLNQFYSGRIRSMAIRLDDPDGGATVIRPVALCSETDLGAYAKACGAPIIPCATCGSQDGLKRQAIKALLETLEVDNPKLRGNLFASLGNIEPGHLLDDSLTRDAVSPASESQGLLQIHDPGGN